MDLKDARTKLNAIDDDIKRLFIERMNIVKDVALFKKANNMPIYDENREKEMINRLSSNMNELKPYYLNLLSAILKESKDYQKKIIG